MTPTDAIESRARILAEARRLFVLHGYHGLSMRAIAQAAHVSKSALYHHFADKEALFLTVLTGYLDELEQLVEAAEAEGTGCRERIALIVQRILAQPAEQRAVIRLASEIEELSDDARRDFGERYHARFTGRIEAILRAGLASGELRPLDPAVMTWALLGMMYPYFYPSTSHARPPSARTVEHLLSIYFDGAGAP